MKKYIFIIPLTLSSLCSSAQEFQFLNVFVEGQIYEHAVEELEIEPQLAEFLATMSGCTGRLTRCHFKEIRLMFRAVFTPLSSNPKMSFQ